jgi:hypothetical protein
MYGEEVLGWLCRENSIGALESLGGFAEEVMRVFGYLWQLWLVSTAPV